jgi:K+-sensing histidine kinase KdpD
MRAPLAAMVCSSNVLLTEIKDKKLLEILMPIKTASKMLHLQVNDLLDSSLLLYGKFALNFTEFNLLEAVKEVVDIVDYDNSRQNKMEILFD